MTKLTCDNACGYTEFTAAPRHFIGDRCPGCLHGHMTTDRVTVEPSLCFRCRAPLNLNSTGVCGQCNLKNWFKSGRIVRHGRI